MPRKNKEDGEAIAPENEFEDIPVDDPEPKPPTRKPFNLGAWGPKLVAPRFISQPDRVLNDAMRRSYPGDTQGTRQREAIRVAAIVVERELAREAQKLGLNKGQQIAALRYLIAQIETSLGFELPPELPDKAPVLWADRNTKEKINPSKFTRDVYGQWIGKGLTRKHLRDLDEPLYRALSVWEHRHPTDTIQELPTLAQVIDQKIKRLSAEFTPEELRKLGTTLQTRLRRTKK